MLPEAKLDILLAHHASEAELLGQFNSETYVQIPRVFRTQPAGRRGEGLSVGRGRDWGWRSAARRSSHRPRNASAWRKSNSTLEARGEELEQKIPRGALPKDAMDDRNVCWKSAPAPAATRPRCSPATCSGCTSATPPQGWKVEVISAAKATRRLQGNHRRDRRARRIRQAEIRIRRASRAARPGHRDAGTHSHLGGDGRRLPEAEEVDVDIKNAICGSRPCARKGAGGQHVNKTESAIRITHLPTGIVVMMQDRRSQHEPRLKAMNILRSRIYDAERQRVDAERSARTARRKSAPATAASASAPIISRKGRVTDHRINLTLYKLPQVISAKRWVN